jgi:hypothetical protein
MKTRILTLIVAGLLITLAALLAGCNEDTPTVPVTGASSTGAFDDMAPWFQEELAKANQVIKENGSIVPAEIAEITSGDLSIAFWPYTGTALHDSPMDPINVVFKGQASPLQIRQALLSLDGNRPEFPAMPPFTLPWTDAIGGDVQTTYLSEGGWEGCVIQLTLGEYAGLRVHLRLFGTSLSDGEGGTWTLGGAHFEMMIPGTSEHQVMSWELAEQVVMYDMARTGLLGAYPEPTGLINSAPSFRGIPPFIYNGLVTDESGMGPMLLTALEYPVEVQSADYPLPTDGQGTLFILGGALPVTADLHSTEVVIDYEQAIPRPLCSDGPYDWLWVTGPITFTTDVVVSLNGIYQYQSSYDAVLTAVPIDIETMQPVGLPFEAQVMGKQVGKAGADFRKVRSVDKRLAVEYGLPQVLLESLQVGSDDDLLYFLYESCFTAD